MPNYIPLMFGIGCVVFLKLWVLAHNENIQLRKDIRTLEKFCGHILPAGQKITREDYPELFSIVQRWSKSDDA